MTYQRVKNVAWRRIGDETILVNLQRRRMLALNGAGGVVWDALAGGTRVPEEAGPFLADLEREGVVERVPSTEEVPATEGPAGEPPAVLWREELNQFGGGCAFHPGEGDVCNQGGTQFS